MLVPFQKIPLDCCDTPRCFPGENQEWKNSPDRKGFIQWLRRVFLAVKFPDGPCTVVVFPDDADALCPILEDMIPDCKFHVPSLITGEPEHADPGAENAEWLLIACITYPGANRIATESTLIAPKPAYCIAAEVHVTRDFVCSKQPLIPVYYGRVGGISGRGTPIPPWDAAWIDNRKKTHGTAK